MLFWALLFLGSLFFSISGLKAFDNVFCKKLIHFMLFLLLLPFVQLGSCSARAEMVLPWSVHAAHGQRNVDKSPPKAVLPQEPGARTGGPSPAQFEEGHLKAKRQWPGLARADRTELISGGKSCFSKFLFMG